MHLFRRLALLLLCSSLIGSVPAQEKKTEPEEKLPTGARLRLGSNRFREANYLSAATMSPSGQEVAVCSGSTHVRFLDSKTGRELRSINIKEYLRTNQMFYTNDGKNLVTAGYNGVHIWDVTDGKQVRTIPPIDKDRRDGQLSISGNGKVVSVSTMYENAVVKVLNLDDGTERGTIKPIHNSTLYSTLSPTGDLVATWGQHYARGNPTPADLLIPRTVHLWDVKTGKQSGAFETDAGSISAVKFSPDGTRVASVGLGIIQLWDTTTGKLVRRFAGRGSSSQTQQILFSPDGKTISVSAGFGSVQSWDIASGKRLGQCEGPTNAQVNLHYRPDGQLIAWGINSNTLVLWEAPSGKAITPVGGHYAPVTSLQFTPDSKQLLTCGQDGRMLRWQIDTGAELEPIELRPESIAKKKMYGFPRTYNTPTLFSPNGKYFIGASVDGSGTSVWEVEPHQELFTLAGAQGYIDRSGVIAFSPDSKKLAAFNRYNGRELPMNIPVWDLESSLPLAPLKGQKGDFTAASFSTDGNILTTCSYAYAPQGGQIAEAWSWDVTTGKVLSKLQIPNTQFQNIAYLDHRLYVLYASNAQAQKIYDAFTGQEVRSLESSVVSSVSSMALSPDRRLIGMALAMADRYSPDGRLVGIERKITVWETASGSIRYEFPISGTNITSLGFSRDGRSMAVALSDTTVLLYDLDQSQPPIEPLKKAELPEHWKTLEEPSARKAVVAMRALIGSPNDAVPFIKEQLKPAEGMKPDAQKIAKLISDLDSPRYIVRESAMKELERLGALAKDAVRAALEKMQVSPEMRERLEKLVDKTNKPDSGTEWIRPLRAIEVLERINNAEAKQHLQTLANGGDTPPTRAAKEALQRLENR